MKPLAVNPRKVRGSWTDGYSLDQHIERSEFTGYDGSGRPTFHTVRTQVGEAVYQLKYGSRDAAEARKLAATAVAFIRRWKVRLDAIIPMPASRSRTVQPVRLVARQIAEALSIELVENAIKRTKTLPEMKNVEAAQRRKVLGDAHQADPARIKGRNVLLLDDLYQTGATMNAVADILKGKGGAAKVYALAITRTKG